MPVTAAQIDRVIAVLTADCGPSKKAATRSATAISPRNSALRAVFSADPDTPRRRASLLVALNHLSSDCTYERYRDVVWAILGTAWPDAESLARDWCASSPDRFDPDDFAAVVKSFDNGRISRPTVGTIVFLARQGGWHG